MLIRILSSKLSPYQNLIEQAISESIPDISPHGANMVFQQLILDQAECWLSFQQRGRERRIEGIVITFIIDNKIMGFKAINILVAYFPDGSSKQTWIELVESLKKYGQSLGCDRIEFFTNVEKIKSIAELVGARYRSTYYQIPFV